MPLEYQTKPKRVEAIQYVESNLEEVAIWSNGAVRTLAGSEGAVNQLGFMSSFGWVTVWPNDWIIKHPDGTYFALHPMVFEAQYEPVQ